MKNWKEVIQQTTFRYIDHSEIETFSGKPYTALSSFAIDDALATSVSNGDSPSVMRLWVHPKTIVLGIPDARLPYIDEGVRFLADKEYNVVIRNSGGLAVALDGGVLNLSLVIPGIHEVSIHDCYEAMVSFVQYMLQDLTNEIEAYEIVHSYCPGDYDLSINGKKFAGISQRRVRDGAAVQIYLDVEGNSYERANLIRDFYRISKKEEETKFTYPEVDPNVMASLSKLLQTNLTVEKMKDRVQAALRNFSEKIVETSFSESERDVFEKRYAQMEKRNKPIWEVLGKY
ncbi:lipoate--protein ligase family protein [Oceanobacillus caeni]|uniref:Octanoyl-[GcvH]:protein N-octanoyltransferase n=1 Tax=Oceanobacillus caeni TaxID=405946 RepID=A0ABR5MH97_9BACI|nr:MULTISPECIES: lipoate--protein ligase family protein [Bacillaceae]KKE77752.1 octanoyltransferase [Bacilli bacterium VT-13-104]PZD87287.1 lipoate--protein ligase family protein [Bacilli bacterium]KPH72787.1 octanoyltransferase [Oceanobacillus caeni]MBU8789865.1 lipoate--protein ligase family protein [Oceanobacillus caeni]MCR1835423.1 lipoate--protein ligase family protein [Oceanobacillus caeni]